MVSRSSAAKLLLLVAILALMTISVAAQNVTTNATNCTCATTAPKKATDTSLRWQGVVVLVAVIVLIVAMAANIVGSTASLFMISLFFYLCGIISYTEVFSGFVNKGTLAVATLFVVVHPMSHLPSARRMVQWLLAPSKTFSSKYFPMIKLQLFAWVTSPLLENVPHVALMTPIVIKVCREVGIHPQQVLMSMSHMVALSNWFIIGSASNLILEAMVKADGEEFGFFELVKTNMAVSFVMIFYFVLMPQFFFPEKVEDSEGAAKGHDAATYDHFTTTLKVPAGSKVHGMTVKSLIATLPEDARNKVRVQRVIRATGDAEATDETQLQAEDEIVVRGDVSHMRSLRVVNSLNWVGISCDAYPTSSRLGSGLVLSRAVAVEESVADSEHKELGSHEMVPAAAAAAPAPAPAPAANVPFADDEGGERPNLLPGLAEGTVAFDASSQTKLAHFVTVIVSRLSPAVDSVIGSHDFTNTYHAAIIACRPVAGGELVGEDLVNHRLHAGDTLLLRTKSADFVDEWKHAPDFYVCESSDDHAPLEVISHSYLQVPQWFCIGTEVRPGGKHLRMPDWHHDLSYLVFIGVVVAAMVEVPLHMAASFGIVALVFLQIITVRQAVQSIDWGVIVGIGFAFCIGSAMTNSGLAAWIGQLIVDANISGFPLLLLIAIMTSLIANITSNKGAIQVIYPVARVVFRAQGLSLLPAAVIIANASICSVMTVYGLAPSMVIAGAGKYVPMDFIKFGTPLTIIFTLLSALITSAVYNVW